MMALWFSLAAALGGMTRYTISRWGWGWYGTLVPNTLGSFLVGWLLAIEPSNDLVWVVGTGFCGALTTFSTFMLDAEVNYRRQRWLIVGITVAVCLGAATVGHLVGR